MKSPYSAFWSAGATTYIPAASLPQSSLKSNTISRKTKELTKSCGLNRVPMTDANIADMPIDAEETLPPGTVLSGDHFTITGTLGAGGFGITYRAQDNVLDRTVVIKECFPEGLCYRDGKDVVARKTTQDKQIRSIVKMFMREARSLAKLRHPNIVGVHGVFEENGTAYMVIDLIEGRDLFEVLDKSTRRLSPARVHDILMQLLDAIGKVHERGLLHRDISPDNIIIENSGTPVLIDFGAARADSNHHTRAISAFLVVKEGYSPQEFYVAGSEQLPCSDLYALGATFYHVLTGRAPPNSQTRMMDIAANRPDPCVPLVGRIDGYDDAFLEAIDSAMRIHPGDRLQSAAKWRALIEASAPDLGSKPLSDLRPSTAAIPLNLELSLSQLVEETNDEVKRTSQRPAKPEPIAKTEIVQEPSKPEWVDEFNKESMAPRPWSRRPTGEINYWIEGPPEEEEVPETWTDERRAHIISKPGNTGTNWIDRALEKQERIRSEREQAMALAEAVETGQVKSKPISKPSQNAADGSEVADEDVNKPSGSMRLAGILFGLLIGLCSVFFLQGA